MNYLIDTNILVIYVRDTDLTRRLEENLRLLTGRNNLVISVVSIGEIKSIAKQNKWGEKKSEKADRDIEPISDCRYKFRRYY
ncbi:MAG: PIN domain-containing protein [Lewinellaceae bacterium]|nr:PIN domain-containing protein [Lewinellaceae bacterium]